MKKVFLVLFSLIMMCSVSFGLEANTVEYSIMTSTSNLMWTNSVGTYTPTVIYNILSNYATDNSNENYKTAFDTLIQDVESLGHKYVVYYNEPNNKYYLLIDNLEVEGIEFVKINEKIVLIKPDSNGGIALGFIYGSNSSRGYQFFCSYSGYQGMYFTNSYQPDVTSMYKSNVNVYQMTQGSNSSKYYWDGFSYYYELKEENDSAEINLTDEQIAELVERFINSDAYLENGYYNGDYFITYDNLTGYFRGYSYAWNIDLAIEYGNYNEEGEFITTGTKEGEAYRIRPYEFSGDIFNKFGDWLASKFNTYAFEYFSISPDSSIKPRYVGSLEHNYCSNYKENEIVIYSSKQIRYVGEETNSEGKTETVVTDNYIPPTVLKDSETGEEIIIRDNLQNSSDNLENIITPNADFSGLKQAFEKYISFVNISSITWLTSAISSMIVIFVPFVALGIIIFLINRILNGGS